MEEETSLHGRIWLLVSHSTPMVHDPSTRLGFSSLGFSGQPRYPESWRLVSDDRFCYVGPVEASPRTSASQAEWRPHLTLDYQPVTTLGAMSAIKALESGHRNTYPQSAAEDLLGYASQVQARDVASTCWPLVSEGLEALIGSRLTGAYPISASYPVVTSSGDADMHCLVQLWSGLKVWSLCRVSHQSGPRTGWWR